MTTLSAADHDDLDPDDPDEATRIAEVTGVDRDVVAKILHAAVLLGLA